MWVGGKKGVVEPMAERVRTRAGERGREDRADSGIGIKGRKEGKGWAVGIGEGGERMRDRGVQDG